MFTFFCRDFYLKTLVNLFFVTLRVGRYLVNRLGKYEYKAYPQFFQLYLNIYRKQKFVLLTLLMQDHKLLWITILWGRNPISMAKIVSFICRPSCFCACRKNMKFLKALYIQTIFSLYLLLIRWCSKVQRIHLSKFLKSN